MTKSKGNSEFCFSETVSVPWGKAEVSTEVDYERKDTTEKICEEIICFTPACHSFKDPDLVKCDSRVHIVISELLLLFTALGS